jgi:membrane associated rhomboid family serine protease
MKHRLKVQVVLLGSILLTMWLLELVDVVVFRGALDAYGIQPRTISGLRGIALAPLLHRGFTHLASNSVGLMIFGWVLLLLNERNFLIVTLLTMVVSGLGVWLVGAAHTVHVGASGVIFGYFGYVLIRGYVQRSVGAILLSLVMGSLYGSMLWGVLPLQVGVSWEGHLFGLVGGVLAAFLLHRRAPSSILSRDLRIKQ